MPDFEPTNDWLDPENKQYLRGLVGNGGRSGGPGRPGIGPGGGYGMFFGMPGVAPSNMSQGGMRTLRRRIGFEPMMGASQPSMPSRMPSGDMGQTDIMGSSSPVSFTGMRGPSKFVQTGGMRGLAQNWNGPGVGRNGTPQNPSGIVNPANQWDYLLGNTDPGWAGYLWRMLGAGGQAGAYDPNGSSALINLARQRVIADQGARERQARLAAQISGGNDPSMGGVGELLATLGTASDASRAQSQAALGSAQDAQTWLRNLFGSQLGMEMQNLNGQRASNYGQQGSNFGDWMSSLGGALLGRTGW